MHVPRMLDKMRLFDSKPRECFEEIGNFMMVSRGNGKVGKA